MRSAFILMLSFATVLRAGDGVVRPAIAPGAASAVSPRVDLDLTQDFIDPPPIGPGPEAPAPSRAWIYWSSAGVVALGGLGWLGWRWLDSRTADPVTVREEQVFTDGG